MQLEDEAAKEDSSKVLEVPQKACSLCLEGVDRR